MRKLAVALLTAAACCWAVAALPDTASDTDTLLHQAVAGSWRSDANKARDQYRHPVETLEFFGFRDDMTVVEIGPGAGWYTEILAPALADHGQLITAPSKVSDKYLAWLKQQPASFGHIRPIAFSPPEQKSLGPDGSADMVLAMRVTHDYLNDSPEALQAVLQAAYQVLKPGGVLGIEEHRGKPNMDPETSSKAFHRIPENYMIAAGLKAGFQLAGISEINANPQDDYSVNVHQLLPDLMGGDQKLKAVGESDRMTLKFVKPKQ